MKAIHVFYIVAIVLSASILSAVCSGSQQELAPKIVESGNRTITAGFATGEQWTVQTVKYVDIGDIIKWEWCSDSEPLTFKIVRPGSGRVLYQKTHVMNDSGTYELRKEDLAGLRAVRFDWGLFSHQSRYYPGVGELWVKKTTNLTYHIEVCEAPRKIPSFEAIFAIAGLLAVAYLLRRK